MIRRRGLFCLSSLSLSRNSSGVRYVSISVPMSYSFLQPCSPLREVAGAEHRRFDVSQTRIDQWAAVRRFSCRDSVDADCYSRLTKNTEIIRRSDGAPELASPVLVEDESDEGDSSRYAASHPLRDDEQGPADLIKCWKSNVISATRRSNDRFGQPIPAREQ